MVVLFLPAMANALGVAAIFAVRAMQRTQRRKRRHGAAQPAANVRLWNNLFPRRNQPRLTDQRERQPL